MISGKLTHEPPTLDLVDAAPAAADDECCAWILFQNAREFAEHEITANCIGPGTIDVERDAFQKPKGLKPQQPIRRLGKPREIVSLMVYLASEDAGYITGQAYLANGGLYFH